MIPMPPRSTEAVLLAARYGAELTAGVLGVLALIGLLVGGVAFGVGFFWAFGCWLPFALLGVVLVALVAGALIGGVAGTAGGLGSAFSGVWLPGAGLGVAAGLAVGYGVGDGLWQLRELLSNGRIANLLRDPALRDWLRYGFAAVGPIGGLFGAFTALNPDTARRLIDRTRGHG